MATALGIPPEIDAAIKCRIARQNLLDLQEMDPARLQRLYACYYNDKYLTREVWQDNLVEFFFQPGVGGRLISACDGFGYLGFDIVQADIGAGFSWGERRASRRPLVKKFMLAQGKRYEFYNRADLEKIATGKPIRLCSDCDLTDHQLILAGKWIPTTASVFEPCRPCKERQFIIERDRPKVEPENVVEPPRVTHVYLVRASGTNRYKVGFTSTAVEKRLSGLRTNAPYPLELVAYREGSKETESALHKILKPYSSHLEWFECEDEQYIKSVFLEGGE